MSPSGGVPARHRELRALQESALSLPQKTDSLPSARSVTPSEQRGLDLPPAACTGAHLRSRAPMAPAGVDESKACSSISLDVRDGSCQVTTCGVRADLRQVRQSRQGSKSRH